MGFLSFALRAMTAYKSQLIYIFTVEKNLKSESRQLKATGGIQYPFPEIVRSKVRRPVWEIGIISIFYPFVQHCF